MGEDTLCTPRIEHKKRSLDELHHVWAHDAIVPLLGWERRLALPHQAAVLSEGQVLHAVQVLHLCRVGGRAVVRVVWVVQEESNHRCTADLQENQRVAGQRRQQCAVEIPGNAQFRSVRSSVI